MDDQILVSIIVPVYNEEKTILEILERINMLEKYCNLEIIIVIRNKPNNSIFRLLKDYNNVQVMWLNQLKFNPTKHFIVPEHVKLTEEESKEIIRYYSLSSKFQLPLLLKDDPISRYYNYRVGDIIKIKQSISCQNKNYVFYRCVR